MLSQLSYIPTCWPRANGTDSRKAGLDCQALIETLRKKTKARLWTESSLPGTGRHGQGEVSYCLKAGEALLRLAAERELCLFPEPELLCGGVFREKGFLGE